MKQYPEYRVHVTTVCTPRKHLARITHIQVPASYKLHYPLESVLFLKRIKKIMENSHLYCSGQNRRCVRFVGILNGDRHCKIRMRNYFQHFSIFFPIISVNMVGIVFPSCFHFSLIDPHTWKSGSKPCNRMASVILRRYS